MRLLGLILLGFYVQLGFSQSANLAENYLDQGEYEKAKVVYLQLLEKNPRSQTFLLGLVDTYKNLDDVKRAKQVLQNFLDRPGDYPHIEVELGYLYDQAQQQDSAQWHYKSALAKVERRPNFAYTVGKAFQKYGLLSFAEQTYETAQAKRPSTNFSIELARIYGEQTKFEAMFKNYVDIIEKNYRYFNMLSPSFSDFLTEDPENPANKAFKQVLLSRNQTDPKLIYNKMLSWLFTQEGNLAFAFVQEKAIYARSEVKQLDAIFELGEIAFAQEQYVLAETIFNHVQATTNQQLLFYRSAQYLLQLLQHNSDFDDQEINQAYTDFFEVEEVTPLTHPIYSDWVQFTANQLQQVPEAISLLDRLTSAQLRPSQLASIRLLKANLYRLVGEFNQALLLYAQVEKLVPNSDLARQAKFETAQTSYFQGDFDWALTQLDVLKQSVSQRISNNALELALHIRDNSYLDSTQTDLKRVAQADLLSSQNLYDQAITQLKTVLSTYKDKAIVDEVMYRIGLNHLNLNEFQAAADVFSQLVEQYPDSILADNALFNLGHIYRDQLKLPEQAKAVYEQLIFKHPDSIYFVEARENFRTLRGDKIE